MKVYRWQAMTTGLKIKQVADASGFTTATLRYYEQIGLLPEASRTPAGYRMYDQRTLDRLAFGGEGLSCRCCQHLSTAYGARCQHARSFGQNLLTFPQVSRLQRPGTPDHFGERTRRSSESGPRTKPSRRETVATSSPC
jgi:DNA-binding transcriptional MerR regulator